MGTMQEENAPPTPSRQTGGSAGRLPPPFTAKPKPQMDYPSLKYPDIESVNPVTLKHAQKPPQPILPRRPHLKSWRATNKERNPLISCLTGPGRAGKYAELSGDAGGLYKGEVLAGKPHGQGQYWAAKSPGSSEQVLQYEGEWVQGRREGNGIRYYANGEQYIGNFVANIRHGDGRYHFSNGDIYVGQWVDDRRTGKGTYIYLNGDIFVGNFILDKKEGLGTMYMMSRQRKYIAEYVCGHPKCGTVLSIEDGDLEPLQGTLAEFSITTKLDLATTGTHVAPLPELQLAQPNKVLGIQMTELRRERQEGPNKAAVKAVQELSGSLTDRELQMLRHSFTLMAGGDSIGCALLPHQLRELVVMAGLDPAAGATQLLVEQLLGVRDNRSGRIGFDEFMKVALHFKDQSNSDLIEEQLQIGATCHPASPRTEYAEDEAAQQHPVDFTDQAGLLTGHAAPETPPEEAIAAEASMQQLAVASGEPAAPAPAVAVDLQVLAASAAADQAAAVGAAGNPGVGPEVEVESKEQQLAGNAVRDGGSSKQGSRVASRAGSAGSVARAPATAQPAAAADAVAPVTDHAQSSEFQADVAAQHPASRQGDSVARSQSNSAHGSRPGSGAQKTAVIEPTSIPEAEPSAGAGDDDPQEGQQAGDAAVLEASGGAPDALEGTTAAPEPDGEDVQQAAAQNQIGGEAAGHGGRGSRPASRASVAQEAAALDASGGGADAGVSQASEEQEAAQGETEPAAAPGGEHDDQNDESAVSNVEQAEEAEQARQEAEVADVDDSAAAQEDENVEMTVDGDDSQETPTGEEASPVIIVDEAALADHPAEQQADASVNEADVVA